MAYNIVNYDTATNVIQSLTRSDLDKLIDYILEQMASGSYTGSIVVGSTYTPIGTFSDTARQGDAGSAGITIVTNTYTLSQVQTTTLSDQPDPPMYIGLTVSGSDVILQENATTLSNLANEVINRMVTDSTYGGVNSYYLSTSAPSDGGVWTSIGQLADTEYNFSVTNAVYYLWKKISAAEYTTNYKRPLKLDSGQVVQFSDTEIQRIIKIVEQQIVSTGIGKYALQSSAPGTGTWVSAGTAVDRILNTATVSFAGPLAETSFQKPTVIVPGTYPDLQNYISDVEYTRDLTYTADVGYATDPVFTGFEAYLGVDFFTGTTTFNSIISYTGTPTYVAEVFYTGEVPFAAYPEFTAVATYTVESTFTATNVFNSTAVYTLESAFVSQVGYTGATVFSRPGTVYTGVGYTGAGSVVFNRLFTGPVLNYTADPVFTGPGASYTGTTGLFTGITGSYTSNPLYTGVSGLYTLETVYTAAVGYTGPSFASWNWFAGTVFYTAPDQLFDSVSGIYTSNPVFTNPDGATYWGTYYYTGPTQTFTGVSGVFTTIVGTYTSWGTFYSGPWYNYPFTFSSPSYLGGSTTSFSGPGVGTTYTSTTTTLWRRIA